MRVADQDLGHAGLARRLYCRQQFISLPPPGSLVLKTTGAQVISAHRGNDTLHITGDVEFETLVLRE